MTRTLYYEIPLPIDLVYETTINFWNINEGNIKEMSEGEDEWLLVVMRDEIPEYARDTYIIKFRRMIKDPNITEVMIEITLGKIRSWDLDIFYHKASSHLKKWALLLEVDPQVIGERQMIYFSILACTFTIFFMIISSIALAFFQHF